MWFHCLLPSFLRHDIPRDSYFYERDNWMKVYNRTCPLKKKPPVLNCMQKYWRLFKIFFILSRKKMGLGFSVDQISLVSLGNYDPHAKNLRFSGFFIYQALLDCTSKPRVLRVLTGWGEAGVNKWVFSMHVQSFPYLQKENEWRDKNVFMRAQHGKKLNACGRVKTW